MCDDSWILRCTSFKDFFNTRKTLCNIDFGNTSRVESTHRQLSSWFTNRLRCWAQHPATEHPATLATRADAVAPRRAALRGVGRVMARRYLTLLWVQLRASSARAMHYRLDFVLDLVRATRPNESTASEYVKSMLSWGAGPRASQMLVLAGKVRALLQGRTHVTLDDIEALAAPALRHRLVPTFHAEAEGITVDQIIAELVKTTKKSEARVL